MNGYGSEFGDLGVGIGSLLGGIGSFGARKLSEKSEKEHQAKEDKDLENMLRQQGYTDTEIATIKYMPSHLRGKALLDLQQQKQVAQQQQASRSAYQNAVANLLGKGGAQEAVDLSALSDKELDKLLNLSMKYQELGSKDVSARQKTAAPIKREIIKEYKSSQKSGDALQQLEDLTNYGDMDSPLWITALRTLRLDSPALMKADSAVFEKVRNEFLPQMKATFGARITDKDLEMFIKGLPDLSQSKEGRLKVIKIMKEVNKASKARYDALKSIEKEHGDKLPYNIESLVEDRVETKLDHIADNLRKIHVPGFGERISEQEPTQEFKSAELPPAASFDGRVLRGPQGQQLKSVNGKWIQIG